MEQIAPFHIIDYAITYALLTSSPINWYGEKTLLLGLGKLNFTQHEYMIGVYSHVLLFVVGYLASLFFKLKRIYAHLPILGIWT